jgi:predicted nucleic acid-binding Zn ribbon protein
MSLRVLSKNLRKIYPRIFWISAVFTKTCHICGKEFQTKANNAKHCSHECKLEAKRRRRIASLEPSRNFSRTCTQCGGPFETRVANKKYCSQECYRLATAERKRVARRKLQKTPRGKRSEKGFQGLCSVCGADDVPVSECPECGYPSCVKCSDESGMCSICSREYPVPVLANAV